MENRAVHRHRSARWRALVLGCLIAVPVLAWPGTASATGSLVPPLPPPLAVLRGFAAPAQPWLPGNRGVDLGAYAGEPVYAAAGGVVGYAGMLAGRGVISISNGSWRTTYEPVDPVVGAGERVFAGQLIGRVSAAADDCGPPGGCLHWGVIRGHTYVDPMRLLGVRRVRLLPIWLDRPLMGP